MPGQRRRLLAKMGALAAVAGISGCGWSGLNSLSLPGTEGRGPGAFTVLAQVPDVQTLQPNSRVRVGDVTVGTVTEIERQGWHALVTMRLNGDVELPANATVKLGQTSVLGSLHLELAPPVGVKAEGQLHDGSVVPLTSSGAYPSTEQTLAALSMVLNGGGVGQVQDITEALTTAFRGREHDVRALLSQLDTFSSHIKEQTDDVIGASESLNRLIGKFADQKPVLDQAIATIPEALAVLNNERDNLAEAADQLAKFSAVTVNTVNQSKENLVKELHELGPTLESLADAGPSLTRALSLLTTFPFANETLDNVLRGDSANLTMIVDLTLSRLDAGLLTGTRFECNLTELELQWGRTIGQFPSPCTSGGQFNQGNPLTIPYHWDQGR